MHPHIEAEALFHKRQQLFRMGILRRVQTEQNLEVKMELLRPEIEELAVRLAISLILSQVTATSTENSIENCLSLLQTHSATHLDAFQSFWPENIFWQKLILQVRELIGEPTDDIIHTLQQVEGYDPAKFDRAQAQALVAPVLNAAYQRLSASLR